MILLLILFLFINILFFRLLIRRFTTRKTRIVKSKFLVYLLLFISGILLTGNVYAAEDTTLPLVKYGMDIKLNNTSIMDYRTNLYFQNGSNATLKMTHTLPLPLAINTPGYGMITLCMSNPNATIPYYEPHGGFIHLQVVKTNNTCTNFNMNNQGKLVVFVFGINWDCSASGQNCIIPSNSSITWTNYYDNVFTLYSFNTSNDRIDVNAGTDVNALISSLNSGLSTNIDNNTNKLDNTIKTENQKTQAKIDTTNGLLGGIVSAFQNLFTYITNIINYLKEILSSDTPTSEIISDWFNDFPGIENNELLQFMTIPVQLLTTILNSNSCTPLTLFTWQGHAVILPCIGSIMRTTFGNVYNIIDLFIAFGIILSSVSYFISVVNDITMLSDRASEKLKIDI